MRLIRIGALVGSVILLVATTVSMVNKRAEKRADPVHVVFEHDDAAIRAIATAQLSALDK